MADVIIDNPVFLGVPDAEIEQNDRTCTWDTNKFGGYPNWMNGGPDAFPSCDVCDSPLYLVAQIYCPLENSQYHRTLYIFGCVNPSCWDNSTSWFILRSQVLALNDKEQKEEKALEGFSAVDDWCDDAGDWGDEEENVDPIMTELESKTSQLTINQTNNIEEKQAQTLPTPRSPPNYSTPCFTPYYVNVFEDVTSHKQAGKTVLTAHEKTLLHQYQQQEGIDLKEIITSTSTNTKGQGNEDYEKTSVAHGDQGFHKFLKYLQSYPQQCIRYQWNGRPLSSSNVTSSDIISTVLPCQYCGAHRVYELQLMPALVPLLKVKQTSSNSMNNPYKDKNSTSLLADKDIASPSNRSTARYKEAKSDILFTPNAVQSPSNKLATPYKDINNDSLVTNGNKVGTVNNVDGCRGDNAAANRNIDEDNHIWKESSSNDKQDSVISENIGEDLQDIKQFKDVISHGEKQGRVEFGTVFVFSCSQSCWDDEGISFRQEYAVLQSDPDAELFQKKL